MPLVLILGFCYDLHFFLSKVGNPKLRFGHSQRTVVGALVEPRFVPPGNPLDHVDLDVNLVGPRAPMNQLIPIGTVDVLG